MEGEAWSFVDGSRRAWLAWECSMHWPLKCRLFGSVRTRVAVTELDGGVVENNCPVNKVAHGMFMVLLTEVWEFPGKGLVRCGKLGHAGGAQSHVCLSVCGLCGGNGWSRSSGHKAK
jgi:hypothetical protein